MTDISKILYEICEDDAVLDPDCELIESGILDSLAFIELITELEDTFNIEIQPTQIPSDTWRSIDGIVKLCLEKKRMI